MLISEFQNRTGIFPSENLYSVIERFYNESKEDKDDFCRRYMMNADCLAERIQTEANKIMYDRENQATAEIWKLEARLEAEKKRADKLKAQLDKELDWKPAEHVGTNMKQTDYLHLAEHKRLRSFPDKEVLDYLSVNFGFMPDKIEIIREVQTFEFNKYHQCHVKDTYHREPLYEASDWNYIRFNCAGMQWELVNGELLPYED